MGLITVPISQAEKHRSVITPIGGSIIREEWSVVTVQKIWLTGATWAFDRNTISIDQKIAEVTSPRTVFIPAVPTKENPFPGHGRYPTARHGTL